MGAWIVVCPLIYPLYSEDVGLKEYLISKGVFVATYWPYVIKTCTPDMISKRSVKAVLSA